MFRQRVVLWLLFLVSVVFAENGAMVLGPLQTGTNVSFSKSDTGEWGIEINGGNIPSLMQQTPVQIEIYDADENILQLAAGYESVQQTASGVQANANVAYGENVVFQVNDQFRVQDNVLSVNRTVNIKGNAPGGFSSALVLAVETSVNWTDINCMIPGGLYGDPTYNGNGSPAGMLKYNARQIFLREDMLSAPMFAFSFAKGGSVTMLDPTPDCASTVDETKLKSAVMTDARFQFGAMGVWQADGGPVAFGFNFPGSMNMYPYGAKATDSPRWIRRYHPIEPGVDHQYQLDFRFAANESFRDVIKNAWRWVWAALQPQVDPIDVEQMRRVLIDHLVAQAHSFDGRTGIPFAVATFDTSELQWNRTMTAMGFVSKNMECADQLLRESERDPSERGQKMRQIGLSIINSMVQALNKVPLDGCGYDLATGKPWTGDHKEWMAPWLRNSTEGMLATMRVYQREKSNGHEHPEWLNWVTTYLDWLLDQQRDDGSFPRGWVAGTDSIADPAGSTSYSPVPLLVLMTEITGNPVYEQAAIRAAEHVWDNYGQYGYYVGGASDNPNITDKEAGMLSIEAFLSLYETTGDAKWLQRAQAAGDYTETWMWIWNLPMPLDAKNENLHWKKGVPTIGLQGITARNTGSTDEYLDWSAPAYVKLYKYTNDPHYLDVARLLLHATKSMVAIPGRQYDLKGYGWQQENFRMGPGRRGRGIGGHRFWLPWVSANHLNSITGIEAFNKELFQQLLQNK